MKDILEHIGKKYQLGMDLYMINGFLETIEEYCLDSLLVQSDSKGSISFKLNVGGCLSRSIQSVDEKDVFTSEVDALCVLRKMLLEKQSGLLAKIEGVTSKIDSMEKKCPK